MNIGLPSHHSTFWIEVKDSAYFFLLRDHTTYVQERVLLWKKHLSTYITLKHGMNTSPNNWGTSFIDTIIFHLDIIDRKFSTLLQFQGLIAIAFSANLGIWWEVITIDWFVGSLLITFTVLWFLTVFICLRAVGRLFWGNLWMIGDTTTIINQHTDALITCVIKRTARFRVAIGIAIFNGALLCGITLLLVAKTIFL